MGSSSTSSIIRTKKDRNHPYFVANNKPFTDGRLSWEARGVLAYLLSKPDDWTVRVPDLIKQGNIGRDAMRRVLRELETYGYLRRRKERDERGRLQWISEVYETPCPENQAMETPPCPDIPSTVEPSTADPATVEPSMVPLKELTNYGLNQSRTQPNTHATQYPTRGALALAAEPGGEEGVIEDRGSDTPIDLHTVQFLQAHSVKAWQQFQSLPFRHVDETTRDVRDNPRLIVFRLKELKTRIGSGELRDPPPPAAAAPALAGAGMCPRCSTVLTFDGNLCQFCRGDSS